MAYNGINATMLQNVWNGEQGNYCDKRKTASALAVTSFYGSGYQSKPVIVMQMSKDREFCLIWRGTTSSVLRRIKTIALMIHG